jgi:succinyl-CoA synthetase beta subunit
MQNVETAFRIILKIQCKSNFDQSLEESFVVIVLLKELLMLQNMGDAIKVPIIVRLQGTNAAKAIDNSGMPILSAVEFQKAADQVNSFSY